MNRRTARFDTRWNPFPPRTSHIIAGNPPTTAPRRHPTHEPTTNHQSGGLTPVQADSRQTRDHAAQTYEPPAQRPNKHRQGPHETAPQRATHGGLEMRAVKLGAGHCNALPLLVGVWLRHAR